MKKQLPKFKSDKDLEKFMDKDLSSYLSKDKLYSATFEFAPKKKIVNLRMSDELFLAVTKISKKRGMPYQRYIREALEQSIKRDIS